MTLDANLWLQTGSPVKQQEVENGRVLEVRDQGKIPADATLPAGGASAAQIRNCDHVASIEA
jgi:cation transport ATPase